MSFWTGNRLLDRLDRDGLVKPFDENRVDCAAYTLSLGAYAFTTTDASGESSSGESSGVIELQEKQQIAIRPGQFAFLLTDEVVTVPDDAIAFISIKTGRKFQGLVNVSGFHVDPGWSSRLIFGVLNAGPLPIVLERRQPLFLLFFADLSSTASQPLSVDSTHVYKEANHYTNIPVDLVQKMSGPVPSLYRLDKATKELDITQRQLEAKIQGAQNTATYAQLAAGLAVIMALAIFGKVIFFPAPTAAVPTTPNVGPSVSTNVTVTPDCADSSCAPKSRNEPKLANPQPRAGAR